MLPERERMAYEAARIVCARERERRASLEGSDKRLFELIESVDVGNYAPKCSEVMAIAKVYENNAINSCMHYFRLGFLKGQRAERNARRKKGAK